MARRKDHARRIPGWLILALAGVFVGAVALPFGRRATASTAWEAQDVASGLSRLRMAVHAYGRDHDHWPGELGEWQLLAQLRGTTDAAGRIGEGAEFVLGPYLLEDPPMNPVGGGRTILVVDRMPDGPTDQGAWLYCSTTGELRADTSGTGTGGRPYFDL